MAVNTLKKTLKLKVSLSLLNQNVGAKSQNNNKNINVLLLKGDSESKLGPMLEYSDV